LLPSKKYFGKMKILILACILLTASSRKVSKRQDFDAGEFQAGKLFSKFFFSCV